MQILIVDDNEANIYMLQALLNGYGYETVAAQNGQDALEIALKAPPDMIVTDILMPVMDGFTLCRKWQQDEILKQIPFVFYTATYTDPKDEQFALNLGADRFIVKPAEPDVLIKILEEVIEDFREDRLTPSDGPFVEDPVYLKEYNETLIRKLEQKLEELESSQHVLENAITELKDTQKKLEDAQRIGKIGNWDWHIVENTLHWSDEIYHIFGVKAQQFKATYEAFLERIHPDDRAAVQQAVDKALHESVPYDIEHRIVHDDGSERIVHEFGEVTFDAQQQPIRMVGMVQDITERKHAEEALLEREILQAQLEKEREISVLKSRFISTVSHEFRTPLATIQTSSEMIYKYQDRLSEDARQRHFNTINEQIQHMVRLLEDVTTIQRADSGAFKQKFATIDLAQYCQDMVNVFCNANDMKHDLYFANNGECSSVTVDKQHIQQIATNLITNAMKYSDAGSNIHFELSCDPDTIEFSVRDEGSGISEQDQARIFEPFHRAENVGSIPGSGLGLSIVKKIVDSYHGEIECDTELGVGTTFIVRLPRNMAEES